MSMKAPINLNGKPSRIRLVLTRPFLGGTRAHISDLKFVLGGCAKIHRHRLRDLEARVTLITTQRNMSLLGPALGRAGWEVKEAKIL